MLSSGAIRRPGSAVHSCTTSPGDQPHGSRYRPLISRHRPSGRARSVAPRWLGCWHGRPRGAMPAGTSPSFRWPHRSTAHAISPHGSSITSRAGLAARSGMRSGIPCWPGTYPSAAPPHSSRLLDSMHSHTFHPIINGQSPHATGLLLGHRCAATTNRHAPLNDATLSEMAGGRRLQAVLAGDIN